MKFAAFDVRVLGLKICIFSQPLKGWNDGFPFAPSVQVVVTVFVPAAEKASDCWGAMALSLLSHLYNTLPAELAVIFPVKVNTPGHDVEEVVGETEAVTFVTIKGMRVGEGVGVLVGVGVAGTGVTQAVLAIWK